jgi:hypothetical protein
MARRVASGVLEPNSDGMKRLAPAAMAASMSLFWSPRAEPPTREMTASALVLVCVLE